MPIFRFERAISLGRQEDRQSDLLLTWSELPRSAGHPFHDEPQAVLRAAGFDRFVVGLCKPYSSCSKRGWKSLPPGRSFRVLLVGYVEGLDSERGIEWRCADDLIRPGNARANRRAGHG
jgi:hypothetical protein